MCVRVPRLHRYREFSALRDRLECHTAHALPDLPGKTLLPMLTPTEAQRRVVGLQRFCERLLEQAYSKHCQQGPLFMYALRTRTVDEPMLNA